MYDFFFSGSERKICCHISNWVVGVSTRIIGFHSTVTAPPFAETLKQLSKFIH